MAVNLRLPDLSGPLFSYLGRFRDSSVIREGHNRQRGQAKVEQVMHEFKEGDLYSSSGEKVTSRDQAIAIAMSEAGLSRKR